LYVYQRVGLVFPMETPNFGESKGNGGLGWKFGNHPGGNCAYQKQKVCDLIMFGPLNRIAKMLRSLLLVDGAPILFCNGQLFVTADKHGWAQPCS
jgi:hypothetical protein